MSIDHYGICESNKRYVYLGKFYEGDVRCEKDINKVMEDHYYNDRLGKDGPGTYYMLRLCAFMRRHREFGVRIVNESDFYDLLETSSYLEDKLE